LAEDYEQVWQGISQYIISNYFPQKSECIGHNSSDANLQKVAQNEKGFEDYFDGQHMRSSGPPRIGPIFGWNSSKFALFPPK